MTIQRIGNPIHFHWLRAPESGTGGGNNPPENPSSDPGNTDAPSSDSQQSNNPGQQADPYAKFWDEPGSGEPSNPQSPTQQTQQPQQPQGNPFQQRLEAMDFGTGAMTQEAFDALGRPQEEGGPDFQTFNQNMTQFGQQVARNSVLMMAELMQAYGNQLEARFQALVEDRLGTDKANDALLKAIPSAKDPRFAPIVNKVYQQALKLNPKDHAAAIQMTKDMLKATGQGLAGDVGLELPPDESGSSYRGRSRTDWAETLMGR